MGKRLGFLSFFVYLFVFVFAGNALADYTCPSYKQYTSCSEGYYMTASSTSTTCDTTVKSGNACRPCSVMGSGYTCAGGTACPKANNVTCSAGRYLAAGRTSCSPCTKGNYCPGGTFSPSSTQDQGLYDCPAGYKDASGIAVTSINKCFALFSGGYIASPGDETVTPCAKGSYKSTTLVYYGDTSTCNLCSGRTKYTSEEGATSCTTVEEGYFTTGCDTSGNGCTGRMACGNSSVYCTGGIKYDVDPGYYSVGGTNRTRTGQEQCTGNTYCLSGVQYSCPTDYTISGTAASDHDAKSDCKITCAAGTRVVTADKSCVTPQGNWYTSAHTVSAGSTSGTNVESCATNYSTPNSRQSGDHDASTDCVTYCDGGEFVAETFQACETVPAGYFKEAHTVSQGSTSYIERCHFDWGGSINYDQSDAGSSSDEDCYAILSGGFYASEETMDLEACAPGTYSTDHRVYYMDLPSGILDTDSCQTCPNNTYSNSGAESCTACDSGYSSSPGSTSATQCTKSCSVPCTRPSCPAHSTSCSFGSETASGTMNQVTQTCSASAPTCSMTFTCETGYQKSGDTCIPNTYEVSYSCGTGSGNAPGGTSQQYGASYVIASNTCSKPGYTFAGWNDGSALKQPGQITWTYTKDITFTAQWTACAASTAGAGTCGCSATQYPNGSGCSNCSVSCSSVSGYTKGTYDVCKSQTNSICYRDCTTSDIPNSSAVSGTVTKGGTNTCTATQCNEHYHLSSDKTGCELDEYTITLNKNGGTGSINGSSGTANATQTCKHGVSCDLPSSGLTRTGFAFTGWGESSGCTSGVNKMTFTAAKTIYACWSQQTTQCQAGKYYNGTSHVDCPSGSFCPGTGFANIGQAGCSTTCPSGYNGSDTGSTAATGCYKTCGGKTITGGTTTVVSAKVYYNGSAYPACTYNVSCNSGYEASGNGTANPTCTKCQDGSYCPGGTAASETCPAGSYCVAGIKSLCPEGGTSNSGAKKVTDCYKICPPTLEIENGQGISTGNKNYNGARYPDCEYTAECDENYVAENSPSASPSCVWGDADECPAGFYCPEGSPSPIACPDGGTSSRGSKEISQCFKIFDPYSGFQNGVASAKCFYITSTNKYEQCNIIEVYSCNAGYWYGTPNAFVCSGVDSGYYSPEGSINQTACPTDPKGSTVSSSEYADNFTDCYKTCEINVANSTSVAAKENEVYGISASEYKACSFAVTCKTGYTVANNNTDEPSCNANTYTITLDKNGGSGSVADSIQCTFDSGACQLPSTTGLTRQGYSITAKWCSDKNGGAPCYDAGTSVSTNISSSGKDITLYAIWTPNIYTVKLNHLDATIKGAPDTVYLKYATGWFSNSAATNSISKLTTIPSKTGYEPAGYYTAQTGGIQVINSNGEFQTSETALKIATSSPTNIYVRWSAGKTTCQPGTYYSGTGTTCITCTANNYCPGGDFATDIGQIEGLNKCPDQGISQSGAKSVADCYKTLLSYNANNGSGTQTCYYDQSSTKYDNNCKDKIITLCNAGYYLSNPDTSNPDCTAVGIGYYSTGTNTSRNQCPNNGLTENTTSSMIQDCYKEGLNYNAVYGTGTQRCFYSSGSGSSAIYQRDCDTKRINSCRGGYWLSNNNDEDCSPVGQNFYSDPNDTQRHECPDNGKTENDIADTIALCYKDGLPYTQALHGIGEYLCYYTSGEGSNAIYASSCETPTMTSCDAGYYYEKTTTVDDCIEAGFGYYSPTNNTNRIACPSNGETETKTSSSASQCFRTDMICTVQNGSGEQTCNYDEASGKYTAKCQTCNVTMCDEGFSIVSNACIMCPEGSICENGEQKTCSSLTGGEYPYSDEGTTNVANCYRNCAVSENAASMSGKDYYKSQDTCKITKCLAGYTLDNNVCKICPAGNFCNGINTPSAPGEDITSCSDLGDGSWNLSLPGGTEESSCYQKCEVYDVINGTAYPIKDTVFYPEECQFEGKSDTGNPCEIIDGVCIETSCNSDYEMKDGICVPCDREHAISYKPTGNCQVEKCSAGYHPKGTECVYDKQECDAPNAIAAEQTWDYKQNAFGTCKIIECASGYHLASNACVSDIQPCNVENGVGTKEWNHNTKNWNECIATTCNPGYTNDPAESNEPLKQCGKCKNMYSVLGEIAATNFTQGCEIASCLYQGELYKLENNECIPICPQEEYEDETGTMVWDKSRKECIRTCKDGYTMW